MKKIRISVAAMALGMPFASIAAGQSNGDKEYSPRGQAVYSIVKKWGPYVQEAYKIDMKGWANEMAPVFAKAPIAKLQSAANARTFDAMNDLLAGNSASASVTPKAIGDIAKDLVYVPITPCRILDTRLAGGQIAAGTVRGVDVTAVSSYAFQGGANTDCGIGLAGSFAAVAVAFTSVAPAQTGYFTAYPLGVAQPLAATQVYTAGGVQTSLAIVQLDQGASANEMNIFSERATHMVADVVGYFTNPSPTSSPAAALECTDLDGSLVNFAAGASNNVFSPSCAAGYTKVVTQCRPSSFSMRVVGTWPDHCNFINEGASAATATAAARCCRVPAHASF